MFKKIAALFRRPEPVAQAKPAATGPKPAEVRAWARENGYEVAERGRIPSTVHQAFSVANKR